HSSTHARSLMSTQGWAITYVTRFLLLRAPTAPSIGERHLLSSLGGMRRVSHFAGAAARLVAVGRRSPSHRANATAHERTERRRRRARIVGRRNPRDPP